MQSLFNEEAYNEIKNRINNLSESSTPSWGKMNIGQMLTHCQKPLEVSMGDMQLPKPNLFFKIMAKGFKKSMYNDKPWRRNLPTAKEYKITDNREFKAEKDILLNRIDAFYNDGDNAPWIVHPAFGEFTKEQWGQLNYKHLDYHLTQFGV